jgi:hypothetical protein
MNDSILLCLAHNERRDGIAVPPPPRDAWIKLGELDGPNSQSSSRA